jgi:hypothetical protein
VLVATFGVRKIANADLGFHLAAGRVISESGSLPRTDVFSDTQSGTAWRNFEWLYQWAVYKAWTLTGPAGVTLAHAALNLLTFAVLAWRVTRRRGVSASAVYLLLLALLVCEVRFTVRPHAAGRLLFVLVLSGLLDRQAGRRFRAWPLFLVQALWCNVHGSYMTGLLLAALVFADDLLDRKAPWRSGLLLLGMAAASCVTPYGWQQTLSLWAHHRAVAAHGGNPEWMPIQLTPSVLGDPALWAYVVLVVWVGRRLWRGTGPGHGWFERAVWLLAAFGPFVHVRTLPMGALALVLLAGSAGARDATPSPKALAVALAPLLLAAVLAVSGVYWRVFRPATESGFGISPRTPGYEAGRFLAASRAGPMFNSYGAGGWLIWWTYPRGGRVFIDGRDVGNVFSPRTLDEYLAILADPAQFERASRLHAWHAVVLERANPACHLLIGYLENHPGWPKAHLDDVCVVFTPAADESILTRQVKPQIHTDEHR